MQKPGGSNPIIMLPRWQCGELKWFVWRGKAQWRKVQKQKPIPRIEEEPTALYPTDQRLVIDILAVLDLLDVLDVLDVLDEDSFNPLIAVERDDIKHNVW